MTREQEAVRITAEIDRLTKGALPSMVLEVVEKEICQAMDRWAYAVALSAKPPAGSVVRIGGVYMNAAGAGGWDECRATFLANIKAKTNQ